MSFYLRTSAGSLCFIIQRLMFSSENSISFKMTGGVLKLGLILTIMLKCIGDASIAVDASPIGDSEGKLVCEFYSKDECASGSCKKEETCPPVEDGKRAHCYALWDNATVVHMKGCWLDHTPCYDQRECVVEPVADGKMFCCCEGSYCNSKLVIPSVLPTQAPRTGTPKPRTQMPPMTGQDTLRWTMLLTIVPLIVISVIVLVIYFVWRNYQLYTQQRQGLEHLYQEPERLLSPNSRSRGAEENLVDVNQPPLPIKKIEVKAHGRFGSVWKAQMFGGQTGQSEIVAVKVFPMQDRTSWAMERDFYMTIFEHKNILRYIGAEQHGADMSAELWLVTEYHEHGSLYDYLKSNTLSVQQLLHIALTMFQGISYLHAVSPAVDRNKPALAHRDIKSRNILLKHDLTACIADFGLVLKLGPGMGTVHNQVGTRRYMSPEVLDGSINFGVDNFLKIDVYASALILWELLSRCCMGEGKAVSGYMMPFEDEVGSKPSLEMMQELVVTRKARPLILQQWQRHSVLSSLCSTVEECWDQDPEARLSAECVEARLRLMTTSLCASVPQIISCRESPSTTTSTHTQSSVVS